MNADELKSVVELHGKWRRGEEGGIGANLADAYLAGADLAGAYLADADLADADLADADLAGADLAGANLAGANLAGAYLAGAYLAGANLAGANLAGAYLADADLAGAYLAGAYLAGANLAGAYLAGAYLADAIGISDEHKARAGSAPALEVPVVPDLHRRMEEATRADGALKMDRWHSCETTHCRGGWAITLAGEAGKKLEEQVGPFRAGCLIYDKSTGYVPHFFAPTDRARKDIERCAAESQEVKK